jgi:hypothetical protein
MTFDIQEVERILNTQFNCKVQDGGYKDHAQGHRTLRIIVGKKSNPAYNPTGLEGQKKQPKMVPDVRIVFMPAGADEDWLIKAVQNIKKTLPENQEITKDESISVMGIGGQFAEAPQPQWDDQQVGKEASKTVENQLDIKEPNNNDIIMGALSDIADTLKGLNDRLNKLEEKKKPGRPKVIEKDIENNA